MSGGLVPFDQNLPADLTQVPGVGGDLQVAGPATPGLVVPDVSFVRDFFTGSLHFPDGSDLAYWSFKDPADDDPFPGSLIRVREGQVVHTTVHPSKNHHTIHHHGIEPSTFNDGVPHTSFAVSGAYTYQWRASRAGTFFYHCHFNTALHFQMGMFGALVVDPPSGPGLLRVGGPSYDAEAIWASYDVDPFWRTYGHAAGLSHAEAGVRLDRFSPRWFTVNGVTDVDSLASPKTTVQVSAGGTVLLRTINAAYSPLRITFPAALQATVVGVDGVPLARGPHRTDVLDTTTAERYEVLLRPPSPGSYPVTYDFQAWSGGRPLGRAVGWVTAT